MPKLTKSEASKSSRGKKYIFNLKAMSVEMFRKVIWRAHWLFPNHISSSSRSDSDFFRERDIKSNLESSLPEGEELRIQAVWGAEVYGPSETGSLCEILTRWGWTAGVGGVKRDGAAEWIHRQRSYGAGGWYNVGMVTSPSDRDKYCLQTNELRMPENVKHLIVEIFQVTPALTCVVVGFVLKEKLSRVYEAELKKSRAGRFERASKRSIMKVSPSELKGRSIVKAREEVRNVAQAWFYSNLPGYFCKSDIQRLPTGELLTTLNEPLLPDDRMRTWAGEGWKEIVMPSSRHDVWSGPDGIKLTSRDGLHGDCFHLVVSMCKSNVTDEAIKYLGERTDSTFVSYCAELMTGVISNFASVGFLTETLKDLRLSRASLEIHKVDRAKGLQTLENIQAFFDRSLGTPAIAVELKNRSEFLSNFQHGCGVFTSPGWRQDSPVRTIAEEHCGYSKTLSSQVISEEHSLREHFEQLSSIISVRESINAQRRMEFLTISALIIAAGSLVVSIVLNPDGFKFLQNVFVDLFGM
ncbi:hypothetical protein NHG95_12470 [Pseudomonas corrugata]|uniref:hypothetical protein n=1 Tax=Pseudomonas corrugata TaxID=47879 RepID=UPI0028C44171|nr:hypothetical protein [Pseudomonas corrugata]MDU9033960.1 hypothetical protein [Pseudomonas corrugata]